MISAFELFKIGIGPSSSHTSGPMLAAKRFRDSLPLGTTRVTAELFGSLAWTGKGHGTGRAICLGLLGAQPSTVDPDASDQLIGDLAVAREFQFPNGAKVGFDPQTDLQYNHIELLPGHSNGMRFGAFDAEGHSLV